MPYGTLSLADLQATALNTTVARIGLSTVFDAIQLTLDAHNAELDSMMGDFVEKSTDRLRRLGGADTMSMVDSDEFTVPPPQKITAGQNVGFPLNWTTISFQWTDAWFKKHTIGELSAQINAAMDADARRVQRDLKRAIFYKTNYDFVDFLNDGVTLPVKRLANADSGSYPPGPDGTIFDGSTLTHYLGTSSFVIGDMATLVNSVRQHYAAGGDIKIYINQAQEATLRGFTSYLTPYVDARIIPASTSAQATGKSLDPTWITNRAIGIDCNSAEVWVKPWVPANYIFAWNAAAPKPVVYRYDPDYGDGLLPIIDDAEDYPWTARGYRRAFGFGIWNRVNGSCLYISNATWADPTIT